MECDGRRARPTGEQTSKHKIICYRKKILNAKKIATEDKQGQIQGQAWEGRDRVGLIVCRVCDLVFASCQLSSSSSSVASSTAFVAHPAMSSTRLHGHPSLPAPVVHAGFSAHQSKSHVLAGVQDAYWSDDDAVSTSRMFARIAGNHFAPSRSS